jgi:predicted acetyltransferase
VEEQKVKPGWTFRWMLRLLDVPGALEARGYPPVSGQAEVTLTDPRFEDVDGATFRIEADNGKIRAARTENSAKAANASVGTFSSLFTGFVSPPDAVRVGALEAEVGTVEFLASLFAGPAPWMPEWF